jgi:hypothetical protein
MVHYADCEIIGTASLYGTCYVDNIAVMTHTVIGPTNGRVLAKAAYPAFTYGNVFYAQYTLSTNTAEFKLWEESPQNATRREPDRVNTFKSETHSDEENYVEAFDVDINPNGTVMGTMYSDNIAISTATITGTQQQSFTFAVPNDKYGRTFYVIYTGTGFKHYRTWYHLRREPDQWTNFKFGPVPLTSEEYVKTWVVTMNPQGTSSGTLFLDNTAISTATFTGTDIQTYAVGVDFSGTSINTGSFLEAYYSGAGAGKFKHVKTDFETVPRPFGKKSWLLQYRKPGGASQCDMARYWSIDVEFKGVGTLTSTWESDNTALRTETLTITNREWRERLAMPPGARGFLFQQRITSAQAFQVFRSNLDIDQEGIKGLVRRTIRGVPDAG